MKKFLSYICTFILMFFMSATVTVWSSSLENKGSITPPVTIGGASSSSLFTGILESFQEEKKISVNGQVTINQEKSEALPLDININLDMTDSNNLKIDGFISFDLFEQLNIIKFSYYDFCVYLSYKDINLKIEQSTMLGFAGAIASLLPEQTMSIDLNAMIEQLMPTLMGALDQIKEETLENGDTLATLNIEDLVSAKILTDSDGLLKSLSFATGYIEGFAVEGDINISFNEQLIIEDPENPSVEGLKKEYYDIEKIVGAINNTTKLKNIFANVNVDLEANGNNNNIEFNILANIANNNYNISLLNNSFGYVDKLNVSYLNDNLYFNINDIYLLANNDLIKEMDSLFGNNKVIENIDTTELKDSATNILTSLKTSLSQDINKIFDLIKHLSIKDNTIKLVINGQMLGIGQEEVSLSLSFNEEVVTSLVVEGLEISGQTIGLSIELEATEDKVSVETINNYTDLYDIYSKNKNLLTANQLDIDVEFKYNEHFVKANIKTNKDLSYAEIIASYLDKNLCIVLDGQEAYLTIDNIKIKIDSQKVKDFINEYVDVDSLIKSVDVPEIPELSLTNTSIKDIISVISKVESVSLVNGNISTKIDLSGLGLEGLTEIYIRTQESLFKSIDISGIKFQGNEINIFVSLNATTFEKTEINKKQYLDLVKFAESTLAIKDLREGSAYLDANVNYKDKAYNIYLSALANLDQNYLKLGLKLSDFDINIDASLYNKTAYIKLNNIYMQFAESDISEILKLIGIENIFGEKENISLSNEMIENNNLVSNLSSFISNISINDIDKIKEIKINNSIISITIDKVVFGIEEDLTINFTIANGILRAVEVSELEITEDLSVRFNLALYRNEVQKQEVEEERYIKVRNAVEQIVNNIDKTQLSLNLQLDTIINNNNLGLNVNVNLDLVKEYLKANLTLDQLDGVDINAILYNNKAFVNINDIFVKLGLNDISKLTDLFGISQETQNLSVSNILSENDLINSIKKYLQNISIKNLKDLDISVEYNTIKLTLDKTALYLNKDIVLEISILGNNQFGIKLSEIEIEDKTSISLSGILDLNGFNIENVNENKYLDIIQTAEQIKQLTEIREGTVSAVAIANINGQKYNGSLNLDANFDINYYNMNFALRGSKTFDLNFNYYDNLIYANIQNIFVKLDLEELKAVMDRLGIQISLENEINFNPEMLFDLVKDYQIVNTLTDVISGLNFNSLKAIKTLRVTSSGITIIIDKDIIGTKSDIKAVISLHNGKPLSIEVFKFDINESDNLSFKINLYQKEVSPASITNKKYLDVAGLLNNTLDIENETNIDIDGYANIYDLVYNKLFGVDLEISKLLTKEDFAGKLSINAFYNDNYYNLDTTLLNKEFFLKLANLQIALEVDKIKDQVNDILTKLNINAPDVDKYLTLAIDIMNNNKSLSDIIKMFNINIGEVKLSTGEVAGLDIIALLTQAIENVKIDNTQISINLDKSIFGTENNIDVKFGVGNNKFTLIDINNLSIEDKIIDCEININYNKLEEIEKPEDDYIKVTDLYNLFDATYNTVKNGTISGLVTLTFDFLKERHVVTADYNLRIINGEIELKLSTTFKGLDVNVYFVDKTIYLEIVGLKIYIEFESLDELFEWIETNYGIKIDIDVKTINSYLNMVKTFNIQEIASGLNIDPLAIIEIINNFKFEDYINNLTIGKTQTEIDFVGGVQFDITYKELGSEGNIVTDLYLEYNEMSMDVDCTKFADFDLGLIENQYMEYSQIIPIIDSIVNTINSQQYKIEVDASLVKDEEVLYDIEANLNLDILNGFGANVGLVMEGLQNIKLDIDFYDEMMYVNYDSLKVCLSQSAFQEIFGIVAGLLGLDEQMTGMLGNAASNSEKFTNENLSSLIPNLDMENPLNMLKYINSISATENSVSVSLKGEFLSSPKPLTISLVVNDGAVDELQIIDIYSNGEFYNISLDFKEFTGIERLTDEAEYLDISDSPDLLRAFINTSELNDYHINGKINLAIGTQNFSVAGIEVDIQIKLDQNNKPIVYVELGNYPLIGLVNNKNTNGVGGIDALTMRERKIYIHYQDGWCYLRTNDEKYLLTKEYDRVTKVPVDYLFNNIGYYMQWLLGFTDTIQNKINESILSSMKDADGINLSNVLLDYKKENGRHRIEINLQEISNNADLGSLVIYLSTINNESTGNKDYLYELGLEMYMLDNFLILMTDQDNKLYLIDIGKELNFTNSFNYMNNYPYNPYGEYEKEGSGSYSQTNTNSSTITVNKNNGEQIDYYTGLAGQTFAPVNPTYITNDGICETTYKFLGYYDDNGNLFTQKYFGANDINLTAKWEVEKIVYYRTITLVNNGSVQTITSLAGKSISISTFDTVVEYKEDGIYTTEFLGWFDAPEGGSLTSYTIMPDYDTTIYAHFKTTVRKYVYLTYNFGGVAENYQTKYLEGETATLVDAQTYNFIDGNIKTTYNFVGWCSDSSCTTIIMDSFVITQDLEVFAKWDVVVTEGYTITVYDGDTQVMNEIVTYVEGQNIPFTSSVKRLDGVKWYTDANYSNLYSEGKEITMPRQNLTLYVSNKYALTVVSNYGTVVNQTYSVYQGQNISQYIPSQSSYMTEVANTSRTYYNFNGYSNYTNTMANKNLTINANWSVEDWYLVSFKTNTTGLSSANKGVSTVNPVWVKEGETLNLSQYQATCEYKWALSTWTCKFKGWKLNGNSVSSIVVTEAVTLEASWGTPLIK